MTMNYCTNKSLLLLAGLMAMGLSACKDNDPDVSGQGNVEDAEYVGKSVGNFSADEWYPGDSDRLTCDRRALTVTQATATASGRPLILRLMATATS